MKKFIVVTTIASAFIGWFLAIGTIAGAETTAIRCDTRIISINDSKLEVLEYCGEPIIAESTGVAWRRLDSGGRALENVSLGEITGVHKWTYRMSNVIYRIVFYGDTVQRIEREANY